jgi:hypothetical protein
MHTFLIVPNCPIPLLSQDIKKKLGVVLVMSHFPGLLMLQKGFKRVHTIPLEVDQQISPFTWYDGRPGRAKTAILLRYNLKTPTTILVVDNILLSKRIKRDYNY